MKKIEIFCFLLIIFLAASLRFYKITEVPPHLYWDEASIAYNAYSINLTGRDEWGQNDPLIFKSFGDYKLPLYIYVVAISQRIFGLTDFSVRFPSALAGTLTVIVIFWLVKEQMYLIGQKFKKFPFANYPATVSLLVALLLAISPWHLQFSRGGFEANLALLLQTLGLLFFLPAVRKNIKLLFVSFLFFAASFYTYHSAAISAPLILLILIFLFRKELLVYKKKVFIAFIFLFLLILPYLPNYAFSALGRIRATSESVFHMPGSPLTNFVNNYVANFSLDYLFFHGDQGGRHSVKKIGELYLWQLPTILAGGYFLLRYRSKTTTILFAWLLIGALPPALTVVSPHALRGLLSVRSWQVLSAIGTIFLLWRFSVINKFRYFLIPIVLYALVVYLHLYYVHYPVAYAADWQDGQRQVVEFLKRVEGGYDQIYVYKSLEPIYIQLYWPINPVVLQNNNHNVKHMDKFTYFDFDTIPQKKNPQDRFLIVLPEWASGGPWNLLRQIKNGTGDPVFNIYEF